MYRTYFVCRSCREGGHPADARLGFHGSRTRQAERLLTLAGGSWSFARASTLLEEFSGFNVSDNTIREVSQRQGKAMADWRHKEPVAHQAFRESDGACEFETDGTCVNTIGGWREMRLGMFAKRDATEPATPDQWGERTLPRPNVIRAFAAVEKGERFVSRWSRWLGRLGISVKEPVHVVADGAAWIWQGVKDQLKNGDGSLDIYHALEHVAEASRALPEKGENDAAVWREEATRRLLEEGWPGILGWIAQTRRTTRKPAVRDALNALQRYLGRQREHLDYRRHLAEGRTIGSGMVEGGCKQIIGRRLKQTGARWRLARLNRMATLCCILHTDEWKTYWNSAG